MTLLDRISLSETINATGESLFFQRTIPPDEARRIAEWIAGRRGLPGSYAGMFAPTEKDRSQGIRLFTGERITSGAATGHILGEEACRILLQLGIETPEVTQALAQAGKSMDACLISAERALPRPGFF